MPQIRYNKYIRGDYINYKFSFWQAIYNYDYFQNNKQYPRKFTCYKTYLFDFYNIKDDPTARVKKVKNVTGKFIDTYEGFDFKNEVNKFCKTYMVKIDVYTINPFELPQIFKIGEVGDFNEVISLLVLPFREGLHFFLITDPKNVNCRLKSISYYNDLMKRKKIGMAIRQEICYPRFLVLLTKFECRSISGKLRCPCILEVIV